MRELPIDVHLPEILRQLRDASTLVLRAEPGAGKTTRVPPALMHEGLAGEREIVVLEPRRLAARLAAQRVAAELGERLGERVGLSVRGESRSGPGTRLRFVTEAVLTRQLVDDPSLEGVAVLVLDEFHERGLHGDLALACARALQAGARPDLKLVLMSATLDAQALAKELGAPFLDVPGRLFPVELEHETRRDERRLEERIASAVARAAGRADAGDLLVFLPGAAEIRRAHEATRARLEGGAFEFRVLHGALPPAEQDRALAPALQPRVIFSTNVAETSVTIDGVRTVIDSGLARVARADTWSGLPRLEIEPISRASAEQRAGRAGRTAPGHCIRLYSAHDLMHRRAADPPEILRSELAELVLTLAAAGHPDPARLPWLDAPPPTALEAARALLLRLGAWTETGLSDLGRELARLPVHPRVGRVFREAAARGAPRRGAALAALLGERELRLDHAGPRSAGLAPTGPSDALDRLDAFEAAESERDPGLAARRHHLDAGTLRRARATRDQLLASRPPGKTRTTKGHDESDDDLLFALLAGFPDRVARRRRAGSPEVLLAGGGAATLAAGSAVRDAPFLVALEAHAARGAGTRVHLASAIEPDWVLELAPDLVRDEHAITFDEREERVIVRDALVYEGLVLDESLSRETRDEHTSACLREAALAAGVGRFCEAETLARWRGRFAFAARFDDALPALDASLLEDTLSQLCEGRLSFAELKEAELLASALARVDPQARARVETLAPGSLRLHAGREVRIVYEAGKDPSVASRMQDFFGRAETPRVAEGRVPLTLHLLAPNQRAVQVTSDLAGFWERHYPTLRKSLMRRYPRHAWPEKPLEASPPPRGRAR